MLATVRTGVIPPCTRDYCTRGLSTRLASPCVVRFYFCGAPGLSGFHLRACSCAPTWHKRTTCRRLRTRRGPRRTGQGAAGPRQWPWVMEFPQRMPAHKVAAGTRRSRGPSAARTDTSGPPPLLSRPPAQIRPVRRRLLPVALALALPLALGWRVGWSSSGRSSHRCCGT